MEALPSGWEAWTWWIFSVVIVGFLLNLATAFLYPKIEKQLARFSETRRKRLEEKNKLFQNMVDEIRNDKIKYFDLKTDLINLQLQVTIISIIGFFVYFLLRATIISALAALIVYVLVSPKLYFLWKIKKLIKASKLINYTKTAPRTEINQE